MLLLTRKSGQSITIQPEHGMADTTPIGMLFSDGPIEIKVHWVMNNRVSFGIDAHHQLHILRDELVLNDSSSAVIPENYNWRQALAGNMFDLRIQRKLSTQELADKSQLSVTTISALERGQCYFIGLDDLQELARALAVNMRVLLKE